MNIEHYIGVKSEQKSLIIVVHSDRLLCIDEYSANGGQDEEMFIIMFIDCNIVFWL